MVDNFPACFELVVGEEGGLDLNPHDRGNWTSGIVGQGELRGTNWGISAAAYPDLNIAGLTLADAQAIYLRDYFVPSGADRVPVGVDAVVFDMSVNAGVSEGDRLLQQDLAVHIDGQFGPITKAAAMAANPAETIRKFTALRLTYYQQAAANNPDEAEDLNGWTNRANAVQAAALAMLQETST